MNQIKFVKSVVRLKDLPATKYPEIVLCGRSNVGKSTFINTLFSRKKIAKTSSTPGKTQTLNYYLVNEKYYIVDLPGFGYAKVPLAEKNAWQKLIEDFLRFSENITYAFHFIDSRYPPTKLDEALNYYLRELEIPYITLLNKIDKLNQSEKSKSIKTLLEKFDELILNENLFLFSSTKGIGKKEVLNVFNKLFI